MEMKMKMIAALALTLIANAASAKTYCRSVQTGGLFGQPVGVRQHCVSINQNSLTDNASTFFGNPPETLPYQIVDGKILVLRQGQWEQAYQIIDADTLSNGAGAVLKAK